MGDTALPALSFNRPYWELVFRGKLRCGEFSVKTRRDGKYSHRGLVLCYSGLKVVDGPVRAYGMNKDAARRLTTVENLVPSGVVGCANILDVRELTTNQKLDLFIGYNNIRNNEYDSSDHELIRAMDFGYFMSRVCRFRKPFVPPVQHMYGPVGRIPLYHEIWQQLPKWARRQVENAA